MMANNHRKHKTLHNRFEEGEDTEIWLQITESQWNQKKRLNGETKGGWDMCPLKEGAKRQEDAGRISISSLQTRNFAFESWLLVL